MEHSGENLARLAKMYRLKPAEVAAEAGISNGTLTRAYNDDAPVETQIEVLQAIERCRRQLLPTFQVSAVS